MAASGTAYDDVTDAVGGTVTPFDLTGKKAFVAGDTSSYITGQILVMDGGGIADV
jgi:hypothetical protein